MWDQQLRHQDDYGIVGMDGDGTDPIYYKAHRALDDLFNRRVIEDPMFHSSQRSQWTQMADVIAWSGFTHGDVPWVGVVSWLECHVVDVVCRRRSNSERFRRSNSERLRAV